MTLQREQTRGRMCLGLKPVLRGHQAPRTTVRKIVLISYRNLPIKGEIDENRGLSGLWCNKLHFQHNKQRAQPLNISYLTHLLWQNLRSTVNSHYTLAQGECNPTNPATMNTSRTALTRGRGLNDKVMTREKKRCFGRRDPSSSRGGRLRTRREEK